MNLGYLTKRKAITELREATGLSIQTCKAKIAALPTRKDGARDKIASLHLHQLISDLKRPPEEPIRDMRGVKPLSKKHQQVIRAGVETRQTLNRLREHARRQATRQQEAA